MTRATFASIAVAVGLVMSTAAPAATVTPTRFDDPVPNGCLPRDCSLREAVIAANAWPGKDTIVLAAGDYELTAIAAGADTPSVADLDVTDGLRIVGSGGSAVTRVINRITSASSSVESRVIEVKEADFVLVGVTLGGGYLRGSEGEGGCLRLTSGWQAHALEDVQVIGCQAAQGGGIYASRLARMDRVVVRGNRAARGGGLALRGAGRYEATALRVEGNEADHQGGGIYVDQGFMNQMVLTLDATSAIVGNSAAQGGGIATGDEGVPNFIAVHIVGPSDGLAVIGANSAIGGGGVWCNAEFCKLSGLDIRENQATFGGAVANNAKMTIADSVLRLNVADQGGAVHGLGADIRQSSLNGNVANLGGAAFFTSSDPVILENVSVFNNTANSGGGFVLDGVGEMSRLVNVSMLDNRATSGDGSHALLLNGATLTVSASWLHDGCALIAGTIQSQGGNAQGVGTPSCGFGPLDLGNVDALAVGAQVQPWGGRFDVIGFAPGQSVLENAAGAASCTATDARGFLRVDGQCDIGAFEATGAAP
jgi:predicted outer membrane repeat protein